MRNDVTGVSRRAFLRRASIVGGAVSAILFVGAGQANADVSGFRWCSRCQSLWFTGGGNNGHCPVFHLWDHSHYRDGSGAYVLRRDVEPAAGEAGWHWCKNCKAVWFLGHGERGAGRCPNNPSGGPWHTQGDLEIAPDGRSWVSFVMEIEEVNNGPGEVQTGWRICSKCNVMFFMDNGLEVTHCPAGGQHDRSESLHYMMRFGRS